MKLKLRALVAVPLVCLFILGGVAVPLAASASGWSGSGSSSDAGAPVGSGVPADAGLLAEYKWSSDSGFDEFAPGGFWIESRTDESQLFFQTDGNLVLYTESGRAVWQSRTYGRGAAKLALQSDGNLVIYRADGTALWSAGVVRSYPTGSWSLVLGGTPASPTITERNRLAGTRDFWRIP